MSRPPRSLDLAPPPPRLSARVRPLMWAHYALTRDRRTRRMWQRRIDAIEQAEAVEDAPTEREKRLLAHGAVWRHVRRTGRRGVRFGLALSALWLAWLLPTYVFGHGFGAWALVFLLPIPVATRLGRRMWESAALEGLRHFGDTPTPSERVATLVRSAMGSFGAGFSFAFHLVFLQGLLTWFMTPAPTLGIEVGLDLMAGLTAGMLCGGASMMLAPSVAPEVKSSQLPYLRLEAQAERLLPEG